jgi:hypothetical protein
MRGILINPFDQTIKEVVYTGDYREIYVLTDCETFDCVTVDSNHTMYVDDEGLLKDNRYFSWTGRNFAGKALILGSDHETGDDKEITLTLEEVNEAVEFLPEGHRETPYMEFKAWS